MHVVRLAEYKNRELVAVIKGLLKLAEDGTAQGLSFVVKLGKTDHRPGLAGDYQRRPEEALAATVRMERHLLRTGGDHAENRHDDFEESRI